MKANRKNPTLIQVSSNGKAIGTMSTKEFRNYMNSTTSFLPALVEQFNSRKQSIGEPERVQQIWYGANEKGEYMRFPPII